MIISKGYTLIEMIIVIAVIGVLASTLIIAINPQRQLAKARDVERETDLITILATIDRYSAEHSGALPDTDGDPETSNFPTTLTCIGTDLGCFDLANAGEDETIVPEYIASLPKDPTEGTDGNTGYLIFEDTNGYLTASSSAETKSFISITQ